MSGANAGSDERASISWPTLGREESVLRATTGLALVEAGTAQLLDRAGELSEVVINAPSRLPGWRRSHVVTHLARNADAMVNLLTWAHTGVEHPMYTSRADRDADIEEGSHRHARLLIEDLRASCARFSAAGAGLSSSDWSSEIVASRDRALPGHEIPWLRLQEVWIHLVDLDIGVEFTDLPPEVAFALLDKVAWTLNGRPDVPPLAVTADFPAGPQKWLVNDEPGGEVAAVRGGAPIVLAWLTGRVDSSHLPGAPELPPWL